VEHGADVNVPDKCGRMPLNAATDEKIKRFLILSNTDYYFYLFYNYKSEKSASNADNLAEMNSLETVFFYQNSSTQRLMLNSYDTRENIDLQTICMKQIKDVEQDFLNSEFDLVVFLGAFKFVKAINISSTTHSSCSKFLTSKKCLFLVGKSA